MTGEEDASDGTPRRATRDERPRDDDHPRPARAAERSGPADGGSAPRRVPRLRPGPDRARRRALGRPADVLRGLRPQCLSTVARPERPTGSPEPGDAPGRRWEKHTSEPQPPVPRLTQPRL